MNIRPINLAEYCQCFTIIASAVIALAVLSGIRNDLHETNDALHTLTETAERIEDIVQVDQQFHFGTGESQ